MTQTRGTEVWRWSLGHPLARFAIAMAPLTLLVLGYVAVLEWWPVARAHTEAVRDIEALKAESGRASADRALLAAYRQAAEALKTVEPRLSRRVTPAEWVEHLSAVAAANEVRILSALYEPPKPGRDEVVVSLSVEGGYADLRALLASLPELPSWAGVEELRLDGATGSGKAVRGVLRLRLAAGGGNP